jgi:Spy/CpxP family protein refolding chaperone
MKVMNTMKPKRKISPITTVTLLALLSSSAVFGQQPGSPLQTQPGPKPGCCSGMRMMRPDNEIGPRGIWWKNPDLVQKLSLTADQQKRIDDIFLQSRIQLVHIKASLEEQELLLKPMLADNPPDTGKAQAQIDRIADLRADLEKANGKMLLAIRGVLTPDQWTKLQEEERGNRHRMIQKRMHGGPDGPPPPPNPGDGPGL